MVRVLVPSGALGLGYDRAALAAGVAAGPDLIAIDGGSTDSGPHYLGTGTSKYSRATTRAEWAGLMAARRQARVPLVIGTAGTCGTDAMVDWLADITREIATETGERLRLARLYSEQAPDAMARAFAAGRIAPLPAAPEVTADTFAGCSHIVALAGAEQIQAALATGADIVIAGRTTDTAIIAALPLMRGCHAGAAWHGAKVGECGALATTRPGSGVVMVEFDATGFTLTPMAEGVRATPETVSAHMLYENADPFRLHEPGGTLDVTAAHYTALDARRTRATGARWEPAARYCVKLEGARPAGFQVVSLVTIRDPRYIAGSADWCADITARARAQAEATLGLAPESFTIELRRIGLDATLGALEPGRTLPQELGILAITTAETEPRAREIAKLLNPFLLHHPLSPDEPMPTFAFPFSPPEMARGAVYEFCLNHVLDLADPMDAFRLETEVIG